MRKGLRRIIVCCIVIVLCLTSSLSAFAMTELEVGEKNLTVTSLVENTFLLSDGEPVAFLALKEMDNDK